MRKERARERNTCCKQKMFAFFRLVFIKNGRHLVFKNVRSSTEFSPPTPEVLNLCLNSDQPCCLTSTGNANQALAMVDANRSSCHENDKPAGFFPPKRSPFSSNRFKKLSAAENGLCLALCDPKFPPLLLPMIPGSSRGQNFIQCSNAAS